MILALKCSVWRLISNLSASSAGDQTTCSVWYYILLIVGIYTSDYTTICVPHSLGRQDGKKSNLFQMVIMISMKGVN